jgi:hypothetical protein
MKILYNTEMIKELALRLPAMTTPRGQLFLKPGIPFAGIRLSIPLQRYRDFLNGLPAEDQPDDACIIPASMTPSATKGDFDVIVDAPLTVRDGKVVADGRPVTLL